MYTLKEYREKIIYKLPQLLLYYNILAKLRAGPSRYMTCEIDVIYQHL